MTSASRLHSSLRLLLLLRIPGPCWPDRCHIPSSSNYGLSLGRPAAPVPWVPPPAETTIWDASMGNLRVAWSATLWLEIDPRGMKVGKIARVVSEQPG